MGRWWPRPASFQRELERFLALVANGSAPASVLEEIRRRESRLKVIADELARYDVRLPDELRLRRLRKQAGERLGKFRELIYGNVPLARQALRKLFRTPAGEFAPLRLTPVVRGGRKTLDFAGEIYLGAVFNNVGAEERT